MAIPTIFRGETESIIASYDAVDVTTGIGWKVFYAAKTMSGANYVLTTNVFYSDSVTTQHATPNTSSAWADAGFSTDFDIVFGKPHRVKGDAIINIPFTIGVGADAHRAQPHVAISKIVDGTPEFLVSGAGRATDGGDPATVPDARFITAALDLTVPETRFNPDDILRVNVSFKCLTANADKPISLGHDPQNRAGAQTATYSWGATDPTRMEVHVPFKVEL